MQGSRKIGQNRLIGDVDVYPDYHQIVISDLGTREEVAVAGSDVTPVEAGDHILFVYAMNRDDSIELDALVKVRMYEGESDSELGERIFNGTIALPQPVLAIGEIMAAPEDMYQAPLANPGLQPLQIFVPHDSSRRKRSERNQHPAPRGQRPVAVTKWWPSSLLFRDTADRNRFVDPTIVTNRAGRASRRRVGGSLCTDER